MGDQRKSVGDPPVLEEEDPIAAARKAKRYIINKENLCFMTPLEEDPQFRLQTQLLQKE